MKPPSIQQAASAAANYNPSTLEKVARALSPHAWSVEAEASDMPWLATAKASSLRKARAALNALRQVDDETVEAMDRANPDAENFAPHRFDVARAMFTAAIDHILIDKD